jgi:hypothetical protein
MPDRLRAGLDALDRTLVPLTWDDVEQRLSSDEHADLSLVRSPGPPGRRRARLLAAAVVVVAVAVTALVWQADSGDVVTDPADPGTSTPSTATTLPATGTDWHTAATAWTGTEYLVWGGQAGGDGTGRADGWRFDPATGETRTIPVAPIAPRDEAVGAWSGTELIVCCGIPIGDGPGYDTASTAAYDPATDSWRVLAPPPPEAAGHALGAVWTGDELLVVNTIGGSGLFAVGLFLHAYDPSTDSWSRLADAPRGDRLGQLLWTGDELIVWTVGYSSARDEGQRYDPDTDTWTALPELPDDHHPWYASAAWVDGQLVVWGIDQQDDLATVGYRWRPGDEAWRPMADAPVEVEHWGEWTPGSQTFAVDPDTGRLLVVAVHPGTSDDGSGDVRSLLSYDPVADRWEVLGEVPPLGYHRIALVADGRVLQPDQADPVAFEVPG